MKITRRKAVAVLGGTVVLVAGVLAVATDAIGLMLLLILATLLGGIALTTIQLAQLRRFTERRLHTIEDRMVGTVRTAISDEQFLRDLRHMAMPQEHADQLLRTIEAGNARLETSHQQLARRVDAALSGTGRVAPPSP